MSNINLLERPARKFVDRFEGGSNGPLFQLFFTAGQEQHGFVFDLVLAKKVAKLLAQHVKAFEEANKTTLDDALDNDPQVSPIQVKMN